MNEEKQISLTGYLIGMLVGAGGLLISNAISGDSPFTKHRIPQTTKVQQRYAVPSKLEIELQDLDMNGQKETILKYDGQSYLLTLDEHGRPRIQAYEIKPAEVIPKE